MKNMVIFTQNTMASIVATREILQKNHHRIKTIVFASQLKGESIKDQLSVAHKLIKKSSLKFFIYKLVESKLYNLLLHGHKTINSRMFKNGKAKSLEILVNEYNIPIIKTNNLSNNDFLEKIKSLNPDYILCLVAQILKKNVFEKLGSRLINSHGSYLPEYRGAAQYFWYLINQDQQIGVSVHFMEPGLDTGPIIHQKKFDYEKKTSVYQLHFNLAKKMGEMLNDFISIYSLREKLPIINQNNEKATFTRMPTKEDIQNLKNKGYKLITVKDFFRYV
jgi:folate-dependent phosphoribosylglycinamide formyltransferase PurN